MHSFPALLSGIIAAFFLASLSTAQSVRVITSEELEKFKPKSVETIKKGSAKKIPTQSSSIISRAPSGMRSSGAGYASVRRPERQNDPDSLTISGQDYVVIESEEAERKVDCTSQISENCLETSFRFLTMTPDGDSLDLSLVLASTEILRFDPDENRFVGSLFVQLRDIDAPEGNRAISSTIQVAVSADVDDINPGALVRFDETNNFKDIALAVKTPTNPTVVKLTPERGAVPQQMEFRVSRPAIKVTLGKEKILGFGLESTSVNVQLEGVTSVPEGAIALSSGAGHLENNTLQVDGMSRTAVTNIRSRGIGPDQVTAELSPFEAGYDDIIYEKPWSWILSVLLGIAVGAGIRLAMRARENSPGTSIGFNIAISICGGIVTAILYALGVNILPIPLPSGFSEGLTFLLSALGGWVFPRWLETFGHRSSGASA